MVAFNQSIADCLASLDSRHGAGNPVLLNSIAEGLTADAKLTGGLGYIATCQSKRPFDELSLDLLQIDTSFGKLYLQRLIRADWITSPSACNDGESDVKPQGGRADLLHITDQSSPLYHVGKLSNISRPAILFQR